jgi:hypothetical protein
VGSETVAAANHIDRLELGPEELILEARFCPALDRLFIIVFAIIMFAGAGRNQALPTKKPDARSVAGS